MTSSSSQSNRLWSEDTEWLSAYLDHEITTEERLSLERRLQTEEHLQQELDELRETVALLRALPTLPPPRSFTLDPVQYQRRRGWGFSWRWASGMVALVCVVALTAMMMADVNESNDMMAMVEDAPVVESIDQTVSSPMMGFREQDNSSDMRQDIFAVPPNPLPPRSPVVPWTTSAGVITTIGESAHPTLVASPLWSDISRSSQEPSASSVQSTFSSPSLENQKHIVNQERQSNREVLAQEENANRKTQAGEPDSTVIPSWRLIGVVFLVIIILLALVGVRVYRRRLV